MRYTDYSCRLLTPTLAEKFLITLSGLEIIAPGLHGGHVVEVLSIEIASINCISELMYSDNDT